MMHVDVIDKVATIVNFGQLDSLAVNFAIYTWKAGQENIH